MNVLDIILLIVGIYQIIFSLINSTSNVKASIIYKVIPFLVVVIVFSIRY